MAFDNVKKLVEDLNKPEKPVDEELPRKFHPRTYLGGKMLKQLSKD
jgi:hypothetical protein